MENEYINEQKAPKGKTGCIGPIGDKGDKGDLGDAGDVGDKGKRGPRGEDGDKGKKGDAGPPGDKGDKGFKGDTGDAGFKGETGLKGEVGPPGPRGDRGDTGEMGPIGEMGPPGFSGPIGPIGPKGKRGVKGDVGDPGPLGNVGLDGFRGDTGPRGLEGLEGPRGPKGDRGIPGMRGLPGYKGKIGDNGISGYKRTSPGEIIIRKVLEIVKNQNLRCFVDTKISAPINFSGLNGINSSSTISSTIFDCISFSGEEVIPIKEIISLSVVFNSENERNTFLENMNSIFMDIKNCTKQSPETVEIDPFGEIKRNIDPIYAFEYIVECNCINDTSPGGVKLSEGGKLIGSCVCMAKKIRVCDIESYEVSILRKSIERAAVDGKTVGRIITYKGDFTDLTDIDGEITIGPTCYGVAIFSHNKDIGRYIATIVNLDNICFIEYN